MAQTDKPGDLGPNTVLRIYGNTVDRTWRVGNEIPPVPKGDMPWMVLATIPLTAEIYDGLSKH